MALIAIGQNRKMEDYLESVRRAGGEPVEVVVGGEPPAQLLARVDGLMLTGGGDVDPTLYGEAPHDTFQAAETGRDQFEIELAREAIKRGLPLLAICRGMQVLNVAMGGTLFQDIPSQVTGAMQHAVPQPRAGGAHEVWVSKESKLSELLKDHMEDGETCHVNSRHHQSVKQVAPGFEVTATSPDGVIEAMEKPDAPYVIAVQWHPENFWRTGEFRELFEGLVQAASRAKR
ncbi:MAG TPA: gamma-glutamyl-gamma-aminobutyrate hydrolase family protein [Vicinamibacterales bacterium]|nr:gamma-glutamyl-gamma-aminobutyrate hydrolase family protein [Vicinamibacterales bacterium]